MPKAAATKLRLPAGAYDASVDTCLVGTEHPVGPGNPLLTPDQVAEMVGYSKKWLEQAREGRNNLAGPPYIKLGNGRTSPIRYKLSSVRWWLEQFPEVVNTSGSKPAMHRSYTQFHAEAGMEDRWLMAVDRKMLSVLDFFSAVGKDTIRPTTRLRWLTKTEIQAGRLFSTELTADELRAVQAARAKQKQLNVS